MKENDNLHTHYYNLLETLSEPGCPICHLVLKNTEHYIDYFIYEKVNNLEIRKKIKNAFGFCRTHAWQIQKYGDGLGQSLIYQSLIQYVLDESGYSKEGQKLSPKKMLSNFGKSKRIASFHKVNDNCLICEMNQLDEKRYTNTLIKNFDTPEFRQAYDKSSGMCLPHIMLTLNNCKGATAAGILEIELKKMDALNVQLLELLRKHDYRYQHEKIGDEKNSWIEAIEKHIGKEGVVTKP